MSSQVPEEVQVFRYEAGDLNYEPRESAPPTWDGDLRDLIGDYVAVESIDAIRSDERSKVESEVERLKGELEDSKHEAAQLEATPPDAVVERIAATERSKVVGAARSQINALRVYNDEEIAAKRGAMEGWVRIDDVLAALDQQAALNQEAPDE